MFIPSPPVHQTTLVKSPKKGETVSFHGRLCYTNGGCAARIWRIGTKRILCVLQDKNKRYLPKNIEHWLTWDTNIYADFTVEYVGDDKEGEEASVYLLSAKHIVVEDLKDPDRPKIFKVPDTAP